MLFIPALTNNQTDNFLVHRTMWATLSHSGRAIWCYFFMIRLSLQVFGKITTGIKYPSHHSISGVHATIMTNAGNVNYMSYCLPGFSNGKFFHLQNLLFGIKLLSLAHTQEGASMREINLHLMEGSVSSYIWKSSVWKVHLLFPIY